ncbi:MAG: hypothetical protein ABSA93_12405, partial [Streptosporangiaceae bacterium]
MGVALPRKACLVPGRSKAGWLRAVGGWARLPRPAAAGRMSLLVLVVLMNAVKPPARVCRSWAVRLCSG